MAQPYRFRPAFGQVKSLFRGARKDTYPLFKAAASDYFARLDAAGLRVRRYDKANARLIDRLVANGGNFWPDSGAFCAMAGYLYPGNGANLIPLKDGHDAGTLNAFVTGDWNAVTGLKGDGSTKFVGTNRSNADDGQDDQSMGFWASALGTNGSARNYLGGGGGDNSATQMAETTTGKWKSRRGNDADVGAMAVGYSAISRDNGANFLSRNDGVEATNSAASNPVTDFEMLVFARMNPTIVGLYNNARLPFYHIGPNLSGTGELAELDSILTDWQTDLANA